MGTRVTHAQNPTTKEVFRFYVKYIVLMSHIGTSKMRTIL
ncbi:hypothetical protein JOD31_001572 [Methylopila capsulata]|uniref:Uncharacterized protein n=1 Tax=Methylopila capsulata TaxID=61654 RepID=A0ABS2T982_9HYPH|nr:hypothetical protein [Methylopila capsulata]